MKLQKHDVLVMGQIGKQYSTSDDIISVATASILLGTVLLITVQDQQRLYEISEFIKKKIGEVPADHFITPDKTMNVTIDQDIYKADGTQRDIHEN